MSTHRRGEIWLADLNPRQGTEPGKTRPVLIVQAQPLLDADGGPITTHVKMLAFNKAENYSNPSDFKAFRMTLFLKIKEALIN